MTWPPPWSSRSVGAAGLLAASLTSAAMACNGDDSSPATGNGNDVHVDVDATTQQGPPSGADAGADSPFAPVEGSVYSKPDGYNPLGVCKSCACPGTDYCFGGGTGNATFGGNCNPTGFAVGCQPLPAACASDASCECLLQATAGQVPCYAVCVQNSRTLYCPNP